MYLSPDNAKMRYGWGMDRRAIALRNLDVADRLVRHGIERITKHQEKIAELEAAGHDVSESKHSLAVMLDIQALHEQERDRLRAELAQ